MKLALRLTHPLCTLPLGRVGTVVGRQWLVCREASPDPTGHCTSGFFVFLQLSPLLGFPYDHVTGDCPPRLLKATGGSSVPGQG